MRSRIAALVVVVAVAGALFAVQGAQVAGADEHDPIGYTIGTKLPAGLGGGTCDFYKIDLETGAATPVNPVSQPVLCGDGLTFDEDGTLYAYRNRPIAGGLAGASELITIDKHTGTQHVVGPLPHVIVGGGGMTFDADGDLWLYALAGNDPTCTPAGTYCLWEVNKKTAASKFVGTAGTGVSVTGLAADCEDVLAISRRIDVGVGAAPAPISTPSVLDELDTNNAALHKQVDVPGIAFATGLDFDAENDLWALANTGPGFGGSGIGMSVFRIDPSNGNTGATDITVNGAPFVGTMNGLGVSPISCDDPGPEPTPAPPAPVAAEPLFTG